MFGDQLRQPLGVIEVFQHGIPLAVGHPKWLHLPG
jgi:hypothetical protein